MRRPGYLRTARAARHGTWALFLAVYVPLAAIGFIWVAAGASVWTSFLWTTFAYAASETAVILRYGNTESRVRKALGKDHPE